MTAALMHYPVTEPHRFPMTLQRASLNRRVGMTIVELLVVVTIVAVLVSLLLPAVQAVREGARRLQCANNLRQVGCALHGHLLAKGRFPIGCVEWKASTGGTKRCLAWSAFILPWLEEQIAGDRVNYKIPYDRGQRGGRRHGHFDVPLPVCGPHQHARVRNGWLRLRGCRWRADH